MELKKERQTNTKGPKNVHAKSQYLCTIMQDTIATREELGALFMKNIVLSGNNA